MIDALYHLGFLVLFPPLLLGVVNKTKAFFAGRKGPPLLQAYRDIAKLARKGVVVSSATTWMFVAGPAVTLVAVLAAGLMVPLGGFPAPVSFAGDMVLFAYLFALGRFFTTAAALDTGSAFEGMGAAREAAFACLSEPALFLGLLALSRESGSLRLADMLRGSAAGLLGPSTAPLALVALGLFAVLLAETCRIPVDDPGTHLELTMIHEAMALDHSGPLLGAVLYGSSLKLFVLGAFLLRLAAPFATEYPWADRLLFAAGMAALAVAIGTVESVIARLRMRRVPYLLTVALLLCGSGFILLAR